MPVLPQDLQAARSTSRVIEMSKAPKVKKIPFRRCTGCGQSLPKKELIRVVRTPEGNVVLDFTGKVSGRGAYVCNNKECIEKLKKQKMLNRAFSCQVADEIYDKIMEDFLGDEK